MMETFWYGAVTMMLAVYVVLDDPPTALERWARLLAPAGRLILVEGFWHTGSSLHRADVIAMLPLSLALNATVHMSDNPAYWGGPVADERYAIIAEHKP